MALTQSALKQPAISITPGLGNWSWPRMRPWMARYIRARARTDQIEALEAMSDAELAALGLDRDRIVLHVFRDLAWA